MFNFYTQNDKNNCILNYETYTDVHGEVGTAVIVDLERGK